MLMTGLSAVRMAALLYPVFQAVVLRWWTSGLRFGAIEARSKLRIRHVYGAYMRFLWWGGAFLLSRSAVLAIPLLIPDWGGCGQIARQWSRGHRNDTHRARRLRRRRARLFDHLSRHRAPVAVAARRRGLATVRPRFAERVEAAGQASSPLGEGLADALNVGGY